MLSPRPALQSFELQSFYPISPTKPPSQSTLKDSVRPEKGATLHVAENLSMKRGEKAHNRAQIKERG